MRCQLLSTISPRYDIPRGRELRRPGRTLPGSVTTFGPLADGVVPGADALGPYVGPVAGPATAVALRVLAEHGLAERGRRGWRRGPAVLDDVAEATGAAALRRDRAERYRQDWASWQARLRQYASARSTAAAPRDGWWPLDDEDEWTAMLVGRWPLLSEDFVRGPPARRRASA